jgi:hypothetical protein
MKSIEKIRVKLLLGFLTVLALVMGFVYASLAAIGGLGGALDVAVNGAAKNLRPSEIRSRLPGNARRCGCQKGLSAQSEALRESPKGTPRCRWKAGPQPERLPHVRCLA